MLILVVERGQEESQPFFEHREIDGRVSCKGILVEVRVVEPYVTVLCLMLGANLPVGSQVDVTEAYTLRFWHGHVAGLARKDEREPRSVSESPTPSCKKQAYQRLFEPMSPSMFCC